ncbi:MAG: ATP-binding protein [Planctomycetota bacterium]|nr:MAG: ATP-binding protein [Planctomycetota bacterium]
MQDYEKLGAFYLGKTFDPEAQTRRDDLLLYDAKDLTTHAVCVGMTGSGKTGLCLTLLEEAAIDGIPAIAIDPKGDIGNLLLTFPQLLPEDFRPWVDPATAARAGMTPDDFALATATQWREGLASWGQEPERIERLRAAAEVTIYTPGSQAGIPLTVLRSFAAPPADLLGDGDMLRERITSSASGLLALLGIDADPLRSREHILLANILDRAWRGGEDVDLGNLIRQIQTPPFDKVGFLDLESFFPAKDRFELAMSLNNLLASPGFSGWASGEVLDVQRLLYTSAGRPRVSIVSIAHLSEAERMFFVTILLNELIAWMRKQSGTSSLRAILYMDEVFGYLPPTANPPSKTPMLTLLKQARAYGLGLVLATQNPVDLDYKALSNAGTWFIGRLQTERDKARVLDGLEGASAAAGAAFDRATMDAMISGLRNRVFLLNDVHEDAPAVFETRWAMSYLRGPLTRDQIATLMQDAKVAVAAAMTHGGGAHAHAAVSSTGARTVLPPDIEEFFVPCRDAISPGEKLVYRPALLGSAKVHYANAKLGIETRESLAVLVDVDGEALPEEVWEDAEIRDDEPPELDTRADDGATFAPLPSPLAQAKTYKSLVASLKNYLYRNRRLTIWKSAELKETSRTGEAEAEFRIRLAHAANERRDAAIEKLRVKYRPKLDSVREQIRKAQQRVDREKEQSKQSMFSAALSFGSSVFGALMSRKMASAANVSKAATAARSAGRVAKERQDIGQAEDTVEAYQARLKQLETEFAVETEKIRAAFSAEALVLDATEVKPKKADVDVSRVVLVWRPWRVAADGEARLAE